LKSSMQTWRRFWGLSGYARGIVLEAAAGLLVTRVGLRVAGFPRWRAALAWLTQGTAAPGSAGRAEIELARTVARWAAAAARHLPFSANCLDRSMTLWWLLRRRGIAADLRIGGRKENGRFEAHAWVELGGEALDDAGGEHRHFQPFKTATASMETQLP
jgi:Transglutaminase-like superfamily